MPITRPARLPHLESAPTQVQALRFLSEVMREDASFERMEELFRQEVSLSTRLLRYLNSAGFGWSHEITSLTHALRLVGLRQLRKWGAMLSVVTLSADRPLELTANALARARFSEQLGQLFGQAGRELELFLTGLLSLMDAMVGRPLEDVLHGMSISQDIRTALLEGGTPMSEVLAVVTAYERADWRHVEGLLLGRELEPGRVHEAYTDSLRWAREAVAY